MEDILVYTVGKRAAHKMYNVCCVQVVSWIVTMWVFGSLLIFLLARVLGGEVSAAHTTWNLTMNTV